MPDDPTPVDYGVYNRDVIAEAPSPEARYCAQCGVMEGAERYYSHTVVRFIAALPGHFLVWGLNNPFARRPLSDGVCTTCAIFCDGCRQYVLESRGIWTPNAERDADDVLHVDACTLCSVQCGSCNTIVDRGDTTRAFDREGFERTIGYDCCWGECDDCGRGYVAGGDAGGTCFNCADSVPSHRIRSYGYKPEPKFFGANNNPYPQFFIGIEQELESKAHESYLERAVAKLDAVDTDHVLYSKQDGSLDCGIEIVSHPMSIPFFQNEYPWDLWKRGDDGLGKYLKQSSNTGVHIHVSKAAFTKAHAYRFTAFHFLNPNFVELVAGRPSNHYTNARPYGDVEDGLRMSYSTIDRRHSLLSHVNQQAKLKTYNYDRYWAVNAQNADTLELRYFRSTTDAARLRFYGEWLESCFLYTNTGWIRTMREERRLTPANYSHWVQKQHSGRWPNVEKFLEKAGLA